MEEYQTSFENSWAYKELYDVRNIKPSFNYGTIAGTLFTGFHWLISRGKEPFTLSHGHADHETLVPASQAKEIDYPKPDGKLSFDLMTNLARSGTNHNENQPAHLKLSNEKNAVDINLKEFAGPEGRFCPAGYIQKVN